MRDTLTEKFRWQCAGQQLDLTARVLVMGILNVTPDSFSDGGRHAAAEAAIAAGLRMAEDGADLIDIGGESTRPGAEPVALEEELHRVLPVVEGLAGRTPALISIDTCKAGVAKRALAAGAHVINDVTGLAGDPAMAGVLADGSCGVVIMHMRGTPQTMQTLAEYADPLSEVERELLERYEAAQAAGFAPQRIVLDPGIGFAKRYEHNLALMRGMETLVERLPRPLLVGPSRKAFIGHILDLPAAQRDEGTAAAVTRAIDAGARIVRVHDVRAMVRVARVAAELASWRAPYQTGDKCS